MILFYIGEGLDRVIKGGALQRVYKLGVALQHLINRINMLAKILKNKTGELSKKSVFGFKRYWRFVKLFFKQIMRRIRRRNPRLTQWDISPLKTQKAANRLFFIFYILSVGCGFVSSVITTKIEEGTIKLQNGYQELADGKHRLSYSPFIGQVIH